MDRELRVEAAAVTVLRLYDVAYAIDLDRVEALGATQAPAVTRLRLTRAEPKAITFGVSPVEIALGPIELPAGDGAHSGSAHARVYDFGVLSLLLRFPIADVGWSGLVDRVLALDRAATATPLWRELLGRFVDATQRRLEHEQRSGKAPAASIKALNFIERLPKTRL